MSRTSLGAPVGVSLALLAAEVLRRRNLAGLVQLDRPAADAAGPAGAVDVVVPARDEAARIGRCVAALRSSRAVGRVIVVDDGSTDGTAELAEAAGAVVVGVEAPPPGWMGKAHACAAGARAASAPWLAFVDADVALHPEALAALVGHCRGSGSAAASPLLRQRCTRPGDRLLVPLAWWQYLVGLPGAGSLLNGQCIVIAAEAYAAMQGHAHPEVRGSLVEDAALGRVVAARGGRPARGRAAGAGEVQMYRGLLEVRSGFGKNMAGFLAMGPWRGALVAAAGITLGAPLLLLVRGLRSSPAASARALLPWLVAGVLLAPRYAEVGAPQTLAAAAPVGAGILQLIAIESLLRQALRRPHSWRGRPARAAR
ncbi:MAG: glycosyltransferase family 2 protein [Candidatus Dormibacteria bacterium]